jgi:acyl-CoA thioesterase I
VKISPNDTIVFIGDSITDCGRERTQGTDWGKGYVFLVGSQLKERLASPHLKIYNRGISGNRIYDLESRIEPDLLTLKPNIVSILIGINDVWRRYDRNLVSPLAEFQAAYHRILTRVKSELDAQLIILEPFLLPVPDDRKQWREDLDPKIEVIRNLATEFHAKYLSLDQIFSEAANKAPASFWIPDGVHPSPAGHALIAKHWMNLVQIG